MSVLDRASIVAPHGYNRWLIVPAALAIHLAIGQVYAFSVFKTPLVELFGTGEVSVAWIFSVGIGMLGLSAAFGGTWVEKSGPRKSMLLAGTAWVVGFFIAAFGMSIGQLWLVYLGYGFIGGIGLGIGYISPVSTLMKWFPDRPGLATGLAIMGFGGGALIASPLSNQLMQTFGGGTELANLVAGVQPTFITLGVIYAVIIIMGAFVIRVPHPDWKPGGWVPDQKVNKMITRNPVAANQALKTPQFWFLWIVLFTNVTAGIGILENAAPMIQDYFPAITAAAAAGFVGLLSLMNMGGRFVWSSVSDYTGRKFIYIIYLGVGVALYFLVASMGHKSLALFIVATLIILSFYGGGFATIPAYLRDLFGTLQVGAIHGRLLTAWSAAGVAGPLIINVVLQNQREAGETSGPGLYQLSLYIMVGVLALGLIANLLVRPVNPKHHASAETIARLEAPTGAEGETGVRINEGGPVHRAVAIVLTVIVVVALGYGLLQTILKAIQIFTG